MSRDNYRCLVSSCGKEFRSDHLRNHYIKNVNFSSIQSGTVQSISEKVIKQHTTYFASKGYTSKDKIPDKKLHVRVKISAESNKRKADSKSGDRLLSMFVSSSQKKSKPNTDVADDVHDNDSSSSDETSSSDEHDIINDSDPSQPSDELELVDSNIVGAASGTIKKTCVSESDETNKAPKDESQVPGDHQNAQQSVSVKKEILSVLGGSDLESEAVVNSLCERIATKVKVTLRESEDKEDKFCDESVWITADQNYMCIPCNKYKYDDSIVVPRNIRSHRRGDLGIVSRDQSKFHLRDHLKQHENKDIHKFYTLRYKDEEHVIEEENLHNYKLAKPLVRNALYCLQRGLSASDFVALNEKDGLIMSEVATRNDSTEEFFIFRKYIYEYLDQQFRAFFTSIPYLSVTLDKVTVARMPYTVILTYFFHDGLIYIFLNRLKKMKSDEYDTDGTASMVISALCSSLRYTEYQLAERLKHFSYDGVYASPEERVGGGGCLSLKETVAEKLGMEPGDISGDWDLAHRLQIIFGLVLKNYGPLKQNIKTFIDPMKKFSKGQQALYLKEFAEEVHYLILEPKKVQETRFVRATLRCYEAGMRNLPAIIELLEKKKQTAADLNNNTEVKKIDKKLKPLKKPKTVALALGFCQLLDIYAKCSLDVQHSRKFPTTCLKSVQNTKDKIKKLSENWEWDDSKLFLAGIGAPAHHIQSLRDTGKFTPYVSENAIRKHREWLAGKYEVDTYLNTLTSMEPDTYQPALEVAGSVSLGVLSDDELEATEEILKKASLEIYRECERYIKVTNLQSSMISCFSSFTAGPLGDRNRLKDLIDNLPDREKDRFNPDEVLPGYKTWKVLRQKDIEDDVGEEETWGEFCRKNMNVEFPAFSALYECLQIRIMSEAIAETVGSVMSIHSNSGGGGRHLQPENFAKEVYIRFNLCPPHLQGPLVQAIASRRIEDDKVYYRRKLNKTRMDKLISEQSATIANRQKVLEKKVHMPLTIFKE